MNDHSIRTPDQSDAAPALPTTEKLRTLVVRSRVKAGRGGTGPSPGFAPSPG